MGREIHHLAPGPTGSDSLGDFGPEIPARRQIFNGAGPGYYSPKIVEHSGTSPAFLEMGLERDPLSVRQLPVEIFAQPIHPLIAHGSS
jgi:hypothetical protein